MKPPIITTSSEEQRSKFMHRLIVSVSSFLTFAFIISYIIVLN